MAAMLPSSLETATTGQRVVCSFCGTRVDPAQVECAEVPSNVRAFKHEVFHVWRCPTCRSLHCLETVDLRRYYTNYPIVRTLTVPARMAFENLLSRLKKSGYAPGSRLLDYGCGWGTFLEHLRERGFHNAVGYDPYSAAETLRDPECLRPEAFEYIVLQDVVEHVEDARVLFSELNSVSEAWRLYPGWHADGRRHRFEPLRQALDAASPAVPSAHLHPCRSRKAGRRDRLVGRQRVRPSVLRHEAPGV